MKYCSSEKNVTFSLGTSFIWISSKAKQIFFTCHFLYILAMEMTNYTKPFIFWRSVNLTGSPGQLSSNYQINFSVSERLLIPHNFLIIMTIKLNVRHQKSRTNFAPVVDRTSYPCIINPMCY